MQNKSKFNLPALFVLVALFSGSAFADDGSEFYLMATPGIRLATEQHAKDENGQMLQDHHFNEGGFKPWVMGFQQDLGKIGKNSSYGLDVCYLQEGHLKNNHRDGFCGLGYYKWVEENGGLKLMIGLGPYAGFNSTNRNQIQRDSKRIGLAATFGLEKELSARLGVNVRVEFMRTDISDSFDGTIMFVGLSKNLNFPITGYDGSTEKSFSRAWDERFGRWSAAFGATQINVPGHNVSQNSFEIERTHSLIDKRPGPIYSLVFKREGDTTLTNRTGVAVQVGYEVRDSNGFVAGGEVGPYLEHDTDSKRTRLDALSRVYLGRQMNNILVSLVFERVAEFTTQARDADTFMIDVGVQTN